MFYCLSRAGGYAGEPFAIFLDSRHLKIPRFSRTGTASAILNSLRTFARNFSNIDFFLKILPLKDGELAMSEM